MEVTRGVTTTYYRSPKDEVVRLRRDGDTEEEWAFFDRSGWRADWRIADTVPWPTYREKLVEIPASDDLVRRTAIDRVRTMHRSVSQVEQYEKCPHAYYLQRIERAWQRPAAWLSQGLAVHKAVEMYERADRQMTVEAAQDVYRSEYVSQTDRLAGDGVAVAHWFPSGPYTGPVDVERRYRLGLDQIERYDTWVRSHPDDVIWITPDGEPAIELEFRVDLDGVEVLGYIDQVLDGFGPRDVKSGNKPGGSFQLGVYDVALAEQYGIPAFGSGDYWLGKTGRATNAYDLSVWSRDAIADRVGAADAAIKAEKWDPTPSADACRMCSVQRACEFSLA